jgi:hypothetical protein
MDGAPAWVGGGAGKKQISLEGMTEGKTEATAKAAADSLRE